MSERNDIDDREPSAEELLLVDLLYGELEPDERGPARERIAADPDRSAELEAFEGLRAVFRDLPEDDPPQAVSARLLHAAAENAPARPSGADAAAAGAAGGGILTKILGLLRPLATNPALAAATMFVMVAGVAGVLYVTGNFEQAKPDAYSESAPPAASTPEPAAAVEGELETADRGDPGVSVELDEAPGDGLTGDRDTAAPSPPPAAPEPEPEPRKRRTKAAEPTTRSGTSRSSSRGYSDDADDDVAGRGNRSSGPGIGKDSKKKAPPSKQPSGGGVTGSAGGDSPLIDAEDLPPQDPAPAEESTNSDDSAPPTTTVEKKPAERKEADKQLPNRDVMVKDLHTRAVQAAKDRECEAVTSLGGRIRSLDGAYYIKIYRKDKRLAACLNAQTDTKK